MNRNHCLAMITLVATCAASGSIAQAQSHRQAAPAQIYWVESQSQAIALAQKFRVPILAYATSSGCHYCRKMERETWSNPQIIEMVEAGYIPLELDAQRDAETIATLRIRAFPTTLLFSPDAKLVTGASGFLQPSQLAGLLRSGQQAQLVSRQDPAPAQP